MKLQKLLIQWILNPLGSKMAAVPQKCRTVGFYLGGAGLFFIYFARGMEVLNIRYFIPFFLGCLFLGLMLLCTLPKTLHTLRFSPVLSICWFGAGFMMLQAAFRLNSDIFSDALMFLVMYPFAWLIWGQGNFSKIAHMLCQLCRWAFVVFFVISFLFFPISSAQYSGLMNNVNGTAFFLSLVLACLTAELWQRGKIDAAFWRDLVLIGLAGAMMFCTNSRTGELAVLCAWLFGGILYLIKNKKNLGRTLVSRILPIVASVVILIPVTVYAGAAIRPVSQMLAEAAYTSAEKNIGAENMPKRDPKHDSGDSPDGLSGFTHITEIKGSTEHKGMDAYSTGRISIWKVFAEHTKLFGTEPPFNYHIDFNDKYYSTAHNTPLEFAINSGWICGVLYFLFNILAGLKSIRYAAAKRSDIYALLLFMITIAFGVCSMLGSLNTPYCYMLSLYYFIFQAPMMTAPAQQLPSESTSENGETL